VCFSSPKLDEAALQAWAAALLTAHGLAAAGLGGEHGVGDGGGAAYGAAGLGAALGLAVSAGEWAGGVGEGGWWAGVGRRGRRGRGRRRTANARPQRPRLRPSDASCAGAAGWGRGEAPGGKGA
jgi:hypothetical protein